MHVPQTNLIFHTFTMGPCIFYEPIQNVRQYKNAKMYGNVFRGMHLGDVVRKTRKNVRGSSLCVRVDCKQGSRSAKTDLTLLRACAHPRGPSFPHRSLIRIHLIFGMTSVSA